MKKIITILLISLALTNCSPEKKDNNDGLLGALALVSQPQNVNLTFSLKSGTRDFEFNKAITVGGNSLTFRDARFYVSSVKLLRADGSTADVTLTSDGVWQSTRVALLDYETGGVTVAGGGSATGTSATNNKVVGTVPFGTYTGIRFDLGVPSDLNHLDASSSSAPLNIINMFWAWSSGYKFVKLEFTKDSDTNYTNFHLGSQNCPTTGATPPTNGTCTNLFRPTISVTSTQAINPSSAVINVDLEKWLDGYTHPTGTKTCMPLVSGSFCNPLVTNVGLNGRVSTTGAPVYATTDAQAGTTMTTFTNNVFKF